MKLLILLAVSSIAAFAQCGKIVPNPLSGQPDCVGAASNATVTSVGTTSPLSGGPITTSGNVSCPTCTTSGSSLGNHKLVTGGGGQAIQTDDATGHTLAAILTCATSSNSGTAEVCNTSPTFTPVAGDSIKFQADIANTGAFTLNVNSLGAKSVKKNGTVALIANDILASPFQVELTYDGTNWEMQGQAGNAASTGANTGCPSTTTTVAGMVCLEAHTASSSTELDFTSCITGAFDEYELTINNIVFSTTLTLQFQMSTNGGSSYDTGSNYSYEYTYAASGGAGQIGAAAQTSIPTRDVGSAMATRGGFNGRFRLYNPGGSLGKVLLGQAMIQTTTSTNNPVVMSGGGFYDSATAVNAFRVIASTGNFTSGVVRCYGVQH